MSNGSIIFAWIALGAGVWANQAFDYERIERAIQTSDFLSARSELEQRVRAAPLDARAQMLLGIVCEEQNEPRLAEQHLRQAARLRPQDPAVHVNLGKNRARHGDWPSAEREFRAALALDPQNSAALSNLGLVLGAEGKDALALAQLQKAAALIPDDVSLRLNLFQVQLKLKRFDDARETAAKIRELSSQGAEIAGRIGAMQAEAGDYTGAIVTLRAALERDSRSNDVAYNLALAYYKMGEVQHASETLERLRAVRDTGELENLLGDVYEKESKYLDAVRAFQRAAELEPANENYRFDYVHELLAHQNFDAAVLVAEPALKDFAGSMKLHLALGVARFGATHYDRALEVLLETAHAFPDSDLPLYFLTFAADTARQKLEETEALLTAFITQHPGQYVPYYLLGHLIDREGDPARALPMLARSIALKPAQPDAQFDLGNVNSELKQGSEAIRRYREAVRLRPAFSEAWYRLGLALRQVGDADGAHAAMQKHEELRKHANTNPVAVFLYKLAE